MNLQDLTLQQLKEILRDAPDGAKWWNSHRKIYMRYKEGMQAWVPLVGWEPTGFAGEPIDSVIKLSDIRTRITELEPVFKVGDWVVYKQGYLIKNAFKLGRGFFRDDESAFEEIRHATAEEIAAGHRIDAISDEMASPCAVSDSAKNQAQMDLQENEPDIITVKLDPKKCRIVDPALAYDEPTKRRVGWVGCLGAGAGATGYVPEGNQNDFDAMSEKHRSPACKCHELPIDAELKPDPVNHPSHYTSDPSGIECIQITRHRNFNIGNAMKYLWRAGLKDQSATAQDLQKAIWYINDEIERLKGEQGE